MKTWLRNLMDATSVMTTSRAIFDLVMLSTKELGFEYFSYIHVDATNLSRLTTLSNFPPQWQARYLEGRYDAFDPVFSRARQSAHAFLWNGEELLRGSRAPIRKMFIEAYDLGIRAGVAIPFETGLRGRGIFKLATTDPDRLQSLKLDPVLSANAVALLHARIEACAAELPSSPIPDLSGRQAMALKWSAEGRTMRDIAKIENTSYSNVHFHLINAKKALRADTLPQATAVATKLGLI